MSELRLVVLHRQPVSVLVLQVHDGEPRSVPELVGEVPGALYPLRDVSGVIARRYARAEHEAKSVGTVLADRLERIDSVAERLAHLASLLVSHEAVDEHVVVRRVSHALVAREHHPDDPEEYDVVSRDQHAVRIEVVEIRRLVRPAERRERPESRTEPCVQNVLVLSEVSASALRADFRHVVRDDDLAALIAVIRRDPVSPPELAADAPVPYLVQPSEVDFAEPLRHEFQASGLDCLDGRLCQLVHLYEPLIGHHRLDGAVASVALADRDSEVLCLHEVTGLFEVLYPCFSACVPVHALVFASVFVHRGIVVHAGYDLEIVSPADFEVVRVVGRRDLHGSRSLFRVRIFVGDDRDLSAHYRQDDLLSDEVLVSFVARMHRDSDISEHGLRPRCGDGDSLASVRGRISEVPVLSVLVLVLDLCVRQRCLAVRAPVDQAVALVYPAFLIKVDEESYDGLVALLVHGEALAPPVAGVAELAALLRDASAVLLLPCPCVLQKFLS